MKKCALGFVKITLGRRAKARKLKALAERREIEDLSRQEGDVSVSEERVTIHGASSPRPPLRARDHAERATPRSLDARCRPP